jgi:hypothetical protein
LVLCRRLRRSELAEVFEHGETLRLQFPKEDLGYLYAAGAGGWLPALFLFRPLARSFCLLSGVFSVCMYT